MDRLLLSTKLPVLTALEIFTHLQAETSPGLGLGFRVRVGVKKRVKREVRGPGGRGHTRTAEDGDARQTAQSTPSSKSVKKDVCMKEWEAVEDEVAKNRRKWGPGGRGKIREVWTDYSARKRNPERIQSALKQIQ